MTSPSVSVVVPTVGRTAELRAIVSTLESDEAVREIIVVDDRARPHQPLGLTCSKPLILVDTGGKGPAPARQAGVEAASGEVILLLDDDVVPAANLARGHAAHHREGLPLLVVGAMPVSSSDRQHGFPITLYAQDYDRWSRLAASDPEYLITHLWGGNVSLRRADALVVGLSSPVFTGSRHEDLEFGLRCRAAGLRAVYDGSLVARHCYRRSQSEFFRDARRQGIEWAALRLVHPHAGLEPAMHRFTSGIPRWLATALELAKTPAIERTLRRSLLLLLRLSSVLHASSAERRIAQVLRRVEQVAGTGEAERMTRRRG
jgi:Glycosyl transferase family 2